MTGASVDLALQRHLTATVVEPDTDLTPAVVADKLGITEPWLVEQLQDIIDAALRGRAVYNREGEHIDDVPALNSAIKGVELLMKYRGMLSEKVEHDHSGTVTIAINGINPEDLR